jgi:glycogen operon protein
MLNLGHPSVMRMVTDSLRYWVTEMHVDGFRFDLATIISRETYGLDVEGGFLHSCRQDPILSGVKLIAEPWDGSADGYQIGSFPPGWGEWNDRFRDTVRAFWRGDEGQPGKMATSLSASLDAFDRRGRRPSSSINFVAAHYGFTLHDVVSYDDKHNEANGKNNEDGHVANFSCNYGVEGPTNDAKIAALRERQKRNMLATLLLAQGTPMLLAGDEFGRTQQGNNNAYAQDNEISWVDWDVTDNGAAMIEFVRRLIALRIALPIFRRSRFLTGIYSADLEVKDVRWMTPSATDMEPEQWQDANARCFGMLMDGRAQATGIKRPSMDATVLLVLNAFDDVVRFRLPEVIGGQTWLCVVDTDAPEVITLPRLLSGEEYEITGRSLCVFATDRPRPWRS